MDWNDELNEEQGGADMLPSVAGDGCEQASEAKEDNAISGTEENEWDRLLRVRSVMFVNPFFLEHASAHV